jgi:hypothetical protein
MKPEGADCTKCKFSEQVDVEGTPGHVCMWGPPADHPILAMRNDRPVQIGMMSCRAALKRGEWCHRFELDLMKGSAIFVGKVS